MTIPGDPAIAAWTFLPAIDILLMNALQHIFWSYYFRQVAPGAITAVLLLIPIGFYLIVRATVQGYVPAWYAAVLAAFVIVGVAQTVRAGDQMTPLIRAINNVGIWISDRIG